MIVLGGDDVCVAKALTHNQLKTSMHDSLCK